MPFGSMMVGGERIIKDAGSTSLPPAFSALADQFPPTVRSLLVDNVEPSTVAVNDLLSDLNWDPANHLLTTSATVLKAPAILNAAACKALRDAVDKIRSVKIDSTDGVESHELPLNTERLVGLIGAAATKALLTLPAQFKGAKLAESKPRHIFVRRYSAETRPWIPFHADVAETTVNVALCDESAHAGGGSLVAVANGAVRRIARSEGDATVHDSRLLHAVTRTSNGVRYSMIIFFGKRHAGEAEEDGGEPVAAPSQQQPPASPIDSVITALRGASLALDAAMSVAAAASSTDAWPAIAPEAQRLIDTLILAQQQHGAQHLGGGATTIPALKHVEESLRQGSAVRIIGLSAGSSHHLNGRCGTIAGGEAEPAWNGERYKVDVRTDEATTSRVLVRPRNLRPADDTNHCDTGNGSAEDLDEDDDDGDACDVELRLLPSLLPALSDELRWRALKEIGCTATSRSDPLNTMAAFPLSARDWIAYRNSLRGGNDDEAAVEPTPLTELKLLLLLLFCPSTTLRHLLECGALPPSSVGRGVIGRGLIAIVDAAIDSSPSDPCIAQLRRWRRALCKAHSLDLGGGPSPVACWTLTLLRANRLTATRRFQAEPDIAGAALRASLLLGCRHVQATALPLHVEKGWLSSRTDLNVLREAAMAHVATHCAAAGIGPTEAVDTSSRNCLAADLLGPNVSSSLDPALVELCRLVDRLRIELSATCGWPLLDVAELQLLDYPEGGHYRRHLDSGGKRVVTRAVSLLLYLTPEGWDVEVDGGQLRAYHQEADEEGEEMVEVAPEAGTLVLFASSKVPHEVVATRRRRLAVAGWLCEQ